MQVQATMRMQYLQEFYQVRLLSGSGRHRAGESLRAARGRRQCRCRCRCPRCASASRPLSCAPQTVRDKCFKVCVTSPGGSLSGSEQKCLSRCMDRYQEVRKPRPRVGVAL